MTTTTTTKRPICLGRSLILWPAHHWAVQVGDIWYEVQGKGGGGGEEDCPNQVSRNTGSTAMSGAGSTYGCEIVGETSKTDEAIGEYISCWLIDNPRYDVLTDNCQSFAYNFIFFLTDGVNFRLPHRLDAARLHSKFVYQTNFWSVQDKGMSVTRLGMGETRASVGHCHMSYCGPFMEFITVKRGGAWMGASPLGRVELHMGALVGVHVEPNINTGLGFRHGNLDAHLLGCGLRAGVDGVEVNTSLGGISLCSIM